MLSRRTVMSSSERTAEPAFLCTSELTLAELLVRPYRDENDGLIKLYDDSIDSGGIGWKSGFVAIDVLSIR